MTQFRLVYAFPLMKNLPQLLHKIEKEGFLVVLIAPNWPRRIKYTNILRLPMVAITSDW